MGKQLRYGISELPAFTGPETESTVYHQVQICASMKSSNGKWERSLPQNRIFHPYFPLRSEKLLRFKTSEHTGEKPPHLPDCVLITTGIYLAWIFISNSLPWSLSKGRDFQQMHLFTCLSRARQPNFSPVSYPSQAGKPKGQAFKRSSALTVSTCSMARSEKPRAVPAPKALQMHQTWEQIRFGETKWHTSTLIF